MLTLPPSVRIFAAVEPVDARKSFDGLAAVVRDSLGGDPMTGHMYFFLNRRGDMAQILFWDRTGFVVMRKRLEAGTFRIGVALILTAHQRWRREAMSTMLSGRDTIWT